MSSNAFLASKRKSKLPSKSVLVCGGYPLTLSANINDSIKRKTREGKGEGKGDEVFDITTFVLEVVHGYGEVICRVDVQGVDGRVSKSKGTEQKAIHGREYVPVGCS